MVIPIIDLIGEISFVHKKSLESRDIFKIELNET